MNTIQQKAPTQEHQNNIPSNLLEQLVTTQQRIEEILSQPHKPAIHKSLLRELNRIKSTFERIQAGTFGRCSLCDAQINASRLRYIPYAELCFACQRDKERQQAE